MYRILLACGSGCSSGFIASAMRKSAKKREVEAEIKAVGDSEIMSYAEHYDILLLGPHIRYRLEEFQNLLHAQNIAIYVIDQKKYGSLDGEGIFEDVINLMKIEEGRE